MEPLKVEIDALQAVMMTPLESFVNDKDAETRTPEKLEALAHKRMFSTAIKAVDKARGERTLYMVVLRHGHGTATVYSGYGPYATKGQAEKATTEMRKAFDHTAYAVVPMRNAEGLHGLLTQLDTEPASKGDFATVAQDVKAFKAGWRGKQKDRNRFVEVGA